MSFSPLFSPGDDRFVGFEQEMNQLEWATVELLVQGASVDEACARTGISLDRAGELESQFNTTEWAERPTYADLLMEGVFRCETISSFREIVASKVILRSDRLSERYRFSREGIPHYAAGSGSVALFDLPWAGLARSCRYLDLVQGYLRTAACSVYLRIPRDKLPDLKHFTPELEKDFSSGNLIPFVEAWFGNDIPLAAVDGCFIFVQSVAESGVIMERCDLSDLLGDPHSILDKIDNLTEKEEEHLKAHYLEVYKDGDFSTPSNIVAYNFLRERKLISEPRIEELLKKLKWGGPDGDHEENSQTIADSEDKD